MAERKTLGGMKRKSAAKGFARPLRKGESTRDKQGRKQTEFTQTLTDRKGRTTNVPSIWKENGRIVKKSPPQAKAAAKRYTKATGLRPPSYANPQEASDAAVLRSRGGGTANGPLFTVRPDRPVRPHSKWRRAKRKK